MRKIKFRAWDGKRIRYDVTGLEHYNQNEMGTMFLDGEPFIISSQFPLMQFTGKFSDDDEEIYEGDIITFNFVYDTKFTKHKGVVSFDESMFVVEEYDKDGEVEDMYSLNNVLNIQMIGNIYEIDVATIKKH